MGIADIFSKRQKRLSGQGDVFEYEQIPGHLRVQVVHIVRDVVGNLITNQQVSEAYREIHDVLAREYGLHELAADHHLIARSVFHFIEHTDIPLRVLDVIEVSFAVALKNQNIYYNAAGQVKVSVSAAIAEINQRFLEAAVGYQYENGRMIRLDSQFVHAEIVKPALTLLSDQRYGGPQEEFLNAHKHYREGKHKECLTDCLKAFESTMKTICDIRKWPYDKTDTARTLIDICFKNGLIPLMLQAQFSALQAILESGVPTLRNKLSGHGQGRTPIVVPQHLAAYTLHLTAANIVLLINSEESLP